MRPPAAPAVAAVLLLALSAAAAVPHTAGAGAAGNLSGDGGAQHSNNSASGRSPIPAPAAAATRPQSAFVIHDLGVLPLQLFAVAPVGDKPTPVLLRVWLKRIGRAAPGATTARRQLLQAAAGSDAHGDGGGGGADGSGRTDIVPYTLPHQWAAALHGFAFAEDAVDPDRRMIGHAYMGVNPAAWQPRLVLEAASGAQIRSQPAPPRINASLHYYLRTPWRPFDFDFPLGNEPGACFKIYDESRPGSKVPFCLPPQRFPVPPAQLCRRLAPPDRYTPASPALWTVIVPFRPVGVKGAHWAAHMAATAARLHNYDLHHEAMGSAGVLLYADHFMLKGLLREPRVVALLRRRRLLLVEWELMDRSPMYYNYDQALVTSHALLGLSSCGTNLVLLFGDVDELLYSFRGSRWPGMLACLQRRSPGNATLFVAHRLDIAASATAPKAEAGLWRAPAASLAAHPLLSYDMVAREPHKWYNGKSLALPAADVAAAFVHDAHPLYGRSIMADARCLIIVHVVNYWHARMVNNDTNFLRHKLRLPYRATAAAAAAAGGGQGLAASAGVGRGAL